MNKILPIILVFILMGCDVTSVDEKKATKLSTSKVELTEQETTSSSATIAASNLDKQTVLKDEQKKNKKTDKPNNQKQQSQDAANIVKGLKDLLEKDKNKGISAIEEVLQDPEHEIRRETLALVYDKAVPVSKTMLRELALNDPNDRVRGTAALNIVDYGKPNEVREYLNEAVNDPNPVISRQAQLRLNKLDLQKQVP